MSAVVYAIVNLVNGKVYVGKANNVRKRWSNHLASARAERPRSAIAHAIKKYGAANFRFQVLETHCSEEGALQGETWWISFLHSNLHGRGYNLDGGGHGGKTLSKSTRQKISAALRGRKKSPEAIAKMRATPRTKPSADVIAKRAASNRGQRRTPEQRARIAASKQGQTFTVEQRARMSAAHMGQQLSDEHKAKISASLLGKKRG